MADTGIKFVITANDKASPVVARTRAGLESISRQLAQLRTAYIAFQGAMGLSGGIRALAEFSDQVRLVDARLKLAAGSARTFAEAQAFSYRVAAQTGAGYEAVATLYGRLAQSAQGLGLSQQQVAATTEMTAKALLVSGASAGESASVIRQFSQALGSGVLRGDEFNSIMENGGRLAKALADGLGLPIGRLRELAEQGLLTTDVVVRALESQRAAIEAEAAAMPQTVGRALSSLRDQFGQSVRAFDQATGATEAVSGALLALGRNMETVLGGAAVAAAGALAAAMTRMTLSAASSVAAMRAKIAEDLRAAASARVIAANEVAKAQAMLASAQAAVAASSGMARLSLVQNTLVPAQQRLAAAQAAHNATMAAGTVVARGLSAALGFMGGPLGLITTLLAAGATAWAVWGDRAQTAADKAKSAVDAARDAAERFRREQKFGAGDEGTLRAGIDALEQRERLLNESVARTRSKGAEAELRRVRNELAQRRQDLLEMERASLDRQEGANGPNALGAELLGKGFDKFVAQFRKKLDPLGAALKELRDEAAKAMIPLDSARFRQAEALLRKSFAEKNGEDRSSARIAAAKAAADAELEILKDGLARAQAAYDAALEDRLISARGYYIAKTAIEQQGIDAEIARTRALAAEQGRIVVAGKNESERLRARGEVAKLEADLIALNNRRADVEQANARRAAQAERELADALAQARDELAQLTGTDTAESRRAAIERSYRDLRARLSAQSDAAGVSLVDRLIDIKAVAGNLAYMEQAWRLALDNMKNAQQAAQIQADAGLITQSGFQQRVAESSRDAATALAALLPAMEQAANTLGNPESIARIAAWKNELASVQNVVDPLAASLDTAIKSGFEDLFTSIGSGAKTAKEAFLDFARSVLSAINKIASQRLAEELFGNLKSSGGTSAGGLISSALKSIGFAGGGYVSGPGSATSDSIPARLSAGEYVVRAAAVRRFGVAFFDAVNGLARPPGLISGRMAMAAGGVVPALHATTPAQTAPQSVRIVNAIDPELARDFLESPAGERVVLNIVTRNANLVRNVL